MKTADLERELSERISEITKNQRERTESFAESLISFVKKTTECQELTHEVALKIRNFIEINEAENQKIRAIEEARRLI